MHWTRTRKIHELTRQGYSTEAVAKEMKMTVEAVRKVLYVTPTREELEKRREAKWNE